MSLELVALAMLAVVLLVVRYELTRMLQTLNDHQRDQIEWMYPVFSPSELRLLRLEREAAARRVDRWVLDRPLESAEECRRTLAVLDEAAAIAALDHAVLANYRVVTGRITVSEARNEYVENTGPPNEAKRQYQRLHLRELAIA